MTLVFGVILIALVFEYVNGFHDTANSIATVVSTRVLTPKAAVILAACMNLIGAMVGTAVARTISSGLVEPSVVASHTIMCALVGAIVWDLITWYVGLPTSSSHALVGGLCGAALASGHGDWNVLIWSVPAATHWWDGKGLVYKVIIPMVTSPVCGAVAGFGVMACLYVLLRSWKPHRVSVVFGKLQLLSASYMGLSHGSNDAQKTMGIIALTLVAATKTGSFDHLPDWLYFLHTPEVPKGQQQEIALWIKVLCALTMAAGTAAGGWRIIRTLGHKMVRLQPVHGFAAETTAATVLFTAARLGMPVSTTHAITASIMGVGATKRFSAVKLGVVQRIVLAWLLTLPASGLIAHFSMRALQAAGAASVPPFTP
jgi:PiT family inorganic phosphate transporter